MHIGGKIIQIEIMEILNYGMLLPDLRLGRCGKAHLLRVCSKSQEVTQMD